MLKALLVSLLSLLVLVGCGGGGDEQAEQISCSSIGECSGRSVVTDERMRAHQYLTIASTRLSNQSSIPMNLKLSTRVKLKFTGGIANNNIIVAWLRKNGEVLYQYDTEFWRRVQPGDDSNEFTIALNREVKLAVGESTYASAVINVTSFAGLLIIDAEPIRVELSS